MKLDSRSVLKFWLKPYIRNDEPKGFSRLHRLASTAKATEPELAKWLEKAVTEIESGVDPKKALSLAKIKRTPGYVP